jgi:hypothetical protein
LSFLPNREVLTCLCDEDIGVIFVDLIYRYISV